MSKPDFLIAGKMGPDFEGAPGVFRVLCQALDGYKLENRANLTKFLRRETAKKRENEV